MLVTASALPEISGAHGHSSIGITDQVYADLGHDAIRGAVDRLAGVPDPSLGPDQYRYRGG